MTTVSRGGSRFGVVPPGINQLIPVKQYKVAKVNIIF
jgi:hypothetical protein